jgi:hypothetical protein
MQVAHERAPRLLRRGVILFLNEVHNARYQFDREKPEIVRTALANRQMDAAEVDWFSRWNRPQKLLVKLRIQGASAKVSKEISQTKDSCRTAEKDRIDASGG